jgi:hypothetical protein
MLIIQSGLSQYTRRIDSNFVGIIKFSNLSDTCYRRLAVFTLFDEIVSHFRLKNYGIF